MKYLAALSLLALGVSAQTTVPSLEIKVRSQKLLADVHPCDDGVFGDRGEREIDGASCTHPQRRMLI